LPVSQSSFFHPLNDIYVGLVASKELNLELAHSQDL
jgi:hypothetical protein